MLTLILFVTGGLLFVIFYRFIYCFEKVYEGERTWPDKIFKPLDGIFFKLGGIDPKKEMNWKQHMLALLTINFIWFLFAMFILMNMSWLPLNPDGNPSMTADLAFNTTT